MAADEQPAVIGPLGAAVAIEQVEEVVSKVGGPLIGVEELRSGPSEGWVEEVQGLVVGVGGGIVQIVRE
eukprot:1207462-Prymnesium_polylepis.1